MQNPNQMVNTIKNPNSLRRLLWAVDPFSEDKSLQRATAVAIKTLTRDSSATIEPVYFFSNNLFDGGPLEIPRDGIRQLQQSGQKELEKILRTVKLENLKPLHIISEPYLSVREGVDQINRLAKRWKADLIVTSTHARKGIKRWVLGSFAETLLLYSETPLFFVNPLWNRANTFRHILFPTDFSTESKVVFNQVLNLVKSLGSHLTLFHKVSYSWPPTVVTAFSPNYIYMDACERELKSKRKLASTWAGEAKAKGITVDTWVDQNPDESVAEAIIRQSKKNSSLIAMASQSSPVRATLLGSTTRKVVRTSPFPVWVLHPNLRVQEESGKVRAIKRDQREPIFSFTKEDIEADLQRIQHVKKTA